MSERDNWREEKRSAHLYRLVAEAEAATPRAGLFRELAAAAEKQAAIWAALASDRGRPVPDHYQPDTRTRLVGALVRRVGPYRLRNVLSAMKVRGMVLYEKSAPGPGPRGAGHEHRHGGTVNGNNLRAAVFGVNDGLVSTASLIMGVAGASADPQTIVLTGIAGLIAGACSMAAGEYVSVRSQREMYEYQIGLEREELEQYPEEEAQELARIYVARGVPEADAQRLAGVLIADPEHALDTLAREELGLNPDDLGSAVGAATSSFLSFTAGALIPLAPFVLRPGPLALHFAIGLTAVALFAVGATLSLFTGRSAFLSGVRMLAIGAAAGGVTYLVGSLLGVSAG